MTIVVKEIDELRFIDDVFGRIFILWITYRAVENLKT